MVTRNYDFLSFLGVPSIQTSFYTISMRGKVMKHHIYAVAFLLRNVHFLRTRVLGFCSVPKIVNKHRGSFRSNSCHARND